jgi:Domain of unknown function (DUF4253)
MRVPDGRRVQVADDLAGRLAVLGIDVPTLEPVAGVAAGVTVLGFSAAGEEALAWWRTLRAVSEDTGYWPVLIESDRPISLAQSSTSDGDPGNSDPEADAATGPAGRLARAAELDAAEILNPGGATLDSLGDEQRRELLEAWPDEPYRIDRFSLPFSRTDQPKPVLVALVAAEHGWQVPALLDHGGWNLCPEPAAHSAVLRYWHDRYGADLVCMSYSSIELAMTRPPRTRSAALALAWEYASYCYDSTDAVYQADDLASLAASLIDAEVMLAWWD